jgi:transcriptional regulator with XRE-family HTH domain
MAIDRDALYSILGQRIREARERVGLSQAKVADRLAMSRTSIVNIEAGRQHPPIHVLWEIADVLGTELALLLPSRSDYDQEAAPVELDADTIEEIESAANGDPRARRDLVAFIGRARHRAQERA